MQNLTNNEVKVLVLVLVLITLLALVGFILNKFISNVTKVNKELNPPKSAPQQESTKIVTCVYNFSHFFWSELGPYRRQFGRKPWCQP